MTESGSAFGMEAEGEASPLDDVLNETVEEPTPEPEAPEVPSEEEPAAPEASPEPAPETPEATDEPAADSPDPAEEPTLYAGRFDSVDKLEESYKEAQRWGTRESQRRAELEKQLTEYKTRIEPYLPHLQRIAAEQQGQGLVNEVGETDPQALQEAIRTQAEAQAKALFTQQQQAQAQAQAQQAISAFEREHPGINGTPVVEDMKRLFDEYRQDDPEFLPTSKETLEVVHTLASDPRVKGMLDALNLFPDREYVEVAKELVDNPALAKVVLAHPHVVDAPKGMDWARDQVNVQAAAPQSTQPTQVREDNKQRAFLEKGGTGAPVNAAPAADSWLAEIMATEDRDAPSSKTLGI